MAARTEKEAVEAYLQPLRQILSCLTHDAILTVSGGYYLSTRPHALTLGDGSAVPLHMRPNRRPIGIALTQHYRLAKVEDGYEVTLAGYRYSFENGEGREYMTFHWHPEGRSAVTWAHLHLGDALGTTIDLSKMHVPTGPVSMGQIVRFALGERDWGARAARDDWRVVLARHESL